MKFECIFAIREKKTVHRTTCN